MGGHHDFREVTIVPDDPESQAARASRRRMLNLLLTGGAAAMLPAAARAVAHPCSTAENPLNWAVAWKQTAAEFHALCYQAFNIATLQLDRALAGQSDGDKPLAVITDMDDTILHANDYWALLIERHRDFFDDGMWDEWIPKNRVTAVPGALEFCHYCVARDVAVFYVTNRDQGSDTRAYARGHLRHLGFPLPVEERLIVFSDTSDKSAAREAIAARYRVPFLIGDNLNDYKRDYYVADVAERLNVMERDREDYGHRFIVLPNPTDGHWVRAIFGESEPAPTDENRRRLRGAAMGIRPGQ
jgi:5'-nucleotidase (lipoprotein e(P4) family)